MATHRPTSPHLQIYQLPLTGMMSITHRITGVLLALGLLLFVGMVSAVAAGSDAYQTMQAIMGFWLVRLLYWGFIYALFFHLCHGVRHLLWDAGLGFARETLERYANWELKASLLLTIVTLLII